MRGAVLLLSLWATAALAVLSITQATRVSLQLKWADRTQEVDQARYLAWAGLGAASHLLASDENPWDAPSEAWAKVPGKPISFTPAPGAFTYQIQDEQAKIPLNAAPQEILERLPGFNSETAQKLIHQRVDPQNPKRVAHLGELWAFTDTDFEPEDLSKLESLTTVHGAGPVNINTASAEVLTQIGFSGTLAARIVIYRLGPDGVLGTSDDGFFTDAEQIQAVFENTFSPLLPEDQLALSDLIGKQLLGIGSSFFRVEVEGQTARHGIRKKVISVLERSTPGISPEVRSWHEDS